MIITTNETVSEQMVHQKLINELPEEQNTHRGMGIFEGTMLADKTVVPLGPIIVAPENFQYNLLTFAMFSHCVPASAFSIELTADRRVPGKLFGYELDRFGDRTKDWQMAPDEIRDCCFREFRGVDPKIILIASIETSLSTGLGEVIRSSEELAVPEHRLVSYIGFNYSLFNNTPTSQLNASVSSCIVFHSHSYIEADKFLELVKKRREDEAGLDVHPTPFIIYSHQKTPQTLPDATEWIQIRNGWEKAVAASLISIESK